MAYLPADNRYDTMIYNRCGRSGLMLPAISLGLWHNFGEDNRPQPRGRSAAPPSISASPISISPTITARRRARPKSCSARSCARDFHGLSRRADHLHQGRLPHVARPLWRMGQPQISARQPRPEPEAHGPRLCRHLLFAPLRSRHAARGDHGRLDQRCARARRSMSASRPTTRQRTREAAAILRELGTPCIIHQPSYSMLNRWIEDDGLLDTLDELASAPSSSRRWRRAC